MTSNSSAYNHKLWNGMIIIHWIEFGGVGKFAAFIFSVNSSMVLTRLVCDCLACPWHYLRVVACTSDSAFGLLAEASTWMPALTRASAVVGPIAATCKREMACKYHVAISNVVRVVIRASTSMSKLKDLAYITHYVLSGAEFWKWGVYYSHSDFFVCFWCVLERSWLLTGWSTPPTLYLAMSKI